MSLFNKGEKKIYHVDHLPEEMKIAIKTIIDSTLPEVAKSYGLNYAYPRVGEPIFIPFGRLDGKFKDTQKAYSKILEEVEKAKEIGISKYQEWYAKAKFYDHYRITFYSTVDKNKGMMIGIGANPLLAIPDERILKISQYIEGKKF
ncbi:hypothetical protein CM19_11170 [Candidatus Acidianus copahuensis]|uniref:Uncharacterized protein n=1 Tax=Candidatus Acidianus copahuensis TaxID=1160895 RepID=A0A031LKU5_9CREN|nr:hypothetical protein [Candidatus Acidianus copahuensis]EZQ02120.1 hypothetical protein CM19_11170 [Candidatus Acidianus copahuensis]